MLTISEELSYTACTCALLHTGDNINGKVLLCLPGSERNAMFGNKIINIIGQMLLLVRECAHPPKPFFTVAVAIEAINSVPSFPSRKECQKILWSQVPTPDSCKRDNALVHQ